MTLNGLSRCAAGVVASKPTANGGPPVVLITSPFFLVSLAVSEISPCAIATDGTFATVCTSAEGSGLVWGPPPPLSTVNAFFDWIAASAPEYEAFSSLFAALSIVSVTTYAPVTIATPSTIANAVSAVRSLRPSRPFQVALIIVPG